MDGSLSVRGFYFWAVPTVRVPLLHLAYNTIAYVPAVIAFVALVRRS